MTVEEKLEKIQVMDLAIDKKLTRKAELKSAAEKTTSGKLDGMPHAPGVSDKVGNMVQKMVDLDAEINRDIDEFADYKDKMCKMIAVLPELQYKVLYLYYVQYMNTTEIAKELHYSPSYMVSVRRMALNSLEKIVKHSKQSCE